MNSDLNETAAWRTFGMLDSDETTSFDEAVRLDPELKKTYLKMNHFTAAVAVTSSLPITPQAGQLAKLQHRLGINQPRQTYWFGISGWAAAAAITMVFLSQRTDFRENRVVHKSESRPIILHVPVPAKPVTQHAVPSTVVAAVNHEPSQRAPQNTKSTADTRLLARVEPRQLTQKIEILEEEVELLQRREKQRLEVNPDMAWPLVVRMRPVQLKSGKKLDSSQVADQPSLTETLGEALATQQGIKDPLPNSDTKAAKDSEGKGDDSPSIISIYDPATHDGQLVAKNLSAPGPDEQFILIAMTETGTPVELGTIDSNGDSTQSFSFVAPSGMNIVGMTVNSVIQADGSVPQSTVIFSSAPP